MSDNDRARVSASVRVDAVGLPSRRPAWAKDIMSQDAYEQLLNELQRVCSPTRQSLPPTVRGRLRARVVKGWQDYAACASADSEAWFPDVQGVPVSPEVTKVCAACPVRRSCLATALLWSVDGIWAGTTSRERGQLVTGMRVGETDEDMAAVLTEVLNRAADRPDRSQHHPSGNIWSGKDAA